jgi:hypothetical protein
MIMLEWILKETRYENVNWIQLAQNSGRILWVR